MRPITFRRGPATSHLHSWPPAALDPRILKQHSEYDTLHIEMDLTSGLRSEIELKVEECANLSCNYSSNNDTTTGATVFLLASGHKFHWYSEPTPDLILALQARLREPVSCDVLPGRRKVKGTIQLLVPKYRSWLPRCREPREELYLQASYASRDTFGRT
jgi:hypothetical protein